MRSTAWIATFGCIALTGCVPMAPREVPIVHLTHPFNPAEVAWANGVGTATLTGQAFFQTGGGTPRTCAGLEVELIPASAYADQRMLALYGDTIHGSVESGFRSWRQGGMRFDDNDPRYIKSQRKTTCDAQGNFIFSKVPAGTYYITSAIVWELPNFEYSGGVLMKRVTLKDGDTERVLLTP